MFWEPLWITVYENLKLYDIYMSWDVLSYHVNVPCSVAIVPLQKPRKADEDPDRCHRDCIFGGEHLQCSASQYPLSFCASVILFVNNVKKTQSTTF